MTTKIDEPGKDPLRPGETAGGKKPFATIDLKATEVGGSKSGQPAPQDAKAPAAKGPSEGGATASGPASGTAKPSSAVPASGTGAASGSGTAASTTAASTAAPASGATSGKIPDGRNEKDGKGAKDGKPAGGAAPNPRRGGGFLSHLTAGIVGGFLALLGADMLGPQIPPIADSLGLPSAAQKTSETTAEIERRLAALEQDAKEQEATAGSDVAARLDATDSRIAELEGLRQSVGALQQTQADLAQKAAALDEKLQAAPEGAAPDARLGKLEQQLDLLSASAGDGNGLPELAALTGRISDLEAALGNQVAALRGSVNKDVDERIAAIAETSESARSATQRMDRELASTTTEAARLGQRFETLKADNSRISDTLRVVQEETGTIRSQLEAFTGDVTQRLAKLTTAEDVSSAVKPVADKIASLQEEVSGVIAAEQDRKANAQRIVLSLELANLKRAVDRGAVYSDELAEVRKASTGLLDLTALEPYETAGVATASELQASFRPVANDILDAAAVPEDGSVLDQLLAGARSVVRIRKVNYDANDQSVEAIVGRINEALSRGRLGDVLSETDKLPKPARQRASEWRKTVEARHAVDQALTQVEDQLKASLSGAPASSGANAN